MTSFRRAILTVSLTLLLAPLALAQRPQVSTVNVTTETDRVRVAPVGSVSDLKIEVTDEAGDTVFEAVQGAHEQVDWAMTDSAGVRVAPGTYTVTVSYVTAAGKARKRIEQLLVTDERTVGGSAAKTAAATSNAPNPQPLVDGGGTTNRVPKFTDADTLTSSVITDVAGRVGIGTTAPAAGLRLDISGLTRMTTGGNGGYMQFGTPNGETGFGWIKGTTSRADLRFNGTTLTLAAGTGINVPPNTYGIVINTAGRVGIGNAAPAYKLDVDGGSGVAVYGHSTTTGVYGSGATYGVYGSGQTNGVYGSGSTYGVQGRAKTGVYGSGTDTGVRGEGSTIGVSGDGKTGVYGETDDAGGTGVSGTGWVNGSYGVSGVTNGASSYAVRGTAYGGGWAGYFDGKVHVQGAFDYSSDRAMKTSFNAVNPRSILHKLSALPIQTWSYKNEGTSVRHLGPVAQDFRAAFGLGSDEKSIGAVDANGVALAAIQGLYQLVLEKDRKIDELQARVARLERAAKMRPRRVRARR